MAIRDLIPWSRQENRLPAPVNSERDSETHPLLWLHRDVDRLSDDVFRGFGIPSFAGFDRILRFQKHLISVSTKPAAAHAAPYSPW